MSDETILNDWLDEWEELNAAGQALSPSEFVARRCQNASPELAEAFQARAQALLSMDARLRSSRGGTPARGQGDTAPPGGRPSALEAEGRTPGGEADTAPPGARTGGLETGIEPVPGYLLVRRIAAGGFGEVWEGISPGSIRVALKFVPLGGKPGNAELAALEQVKDLRHPHLLTLVAAWKAGGRLVIASDLADCSLADRLRQCLDAGQPGVPAEELLGYLRDAAEGLDFLHSRGVQHRDVKPSNLLLVGGALKVADLGLAKPVAGMEASHTGMMTFAYAAPEFFDGKVTPHSDQYSLAVSYCELRGGRLPFAGTNARLMRGHLLDQPDLTMLPEPERAVVSRALNKRPEQRWPSCLALAESLVTALDAQKSATTQHPDGGWAARARAAWYLLVLDEARAEPSLESYFSRERFSEAAQAFCGLGLDQALAALDAGGADLCFSGPEFRRCPERFKFSWFYRKAAENLAWVKGQDVYYSACCCSGLLALLVLDFPSCKERLDRAQQAHDDWAFAHHLSGLLHALNGRLVGARAELLFALQRETSSRACQRIERALRLVGEPAAQ